MPRWDRGDVFSIDVRTPADASATKYRLWLGGATKRIHIVRYHIGSYGSASCHTIGFHRAAGTAITFTAGVLKAITNLNDDGPSVPAGVKAYVTSGADDMPASAIEQLYLSVDLAGGGDTLTVDVPPGVLTVSPGNYIGINQGSFGANISLKANFWFTVE
jgi:hypothetical protein